MPLHVLVGEIQQPPEGGSPSTVNLPSDGSNGSLWVHPSAFIDVYPKSHDSDISTTLQTPEGRVPITVSPIG